MLRAGRRSKSAGAAEESLVIGAEESDSVHDLNLSKRQKLSEKNEKAKSKTLNEPGHQNDKTHRKDRRKNKFPEEEDERTDDEACDGVDINVQNDDLS